ncbi:hypothetical protein [Leeuwenhoekiella nanhaiensis]|uniref:Lipocalin-like domain-containing protein n=1 Tax=Leeuwenhoekiella nanhaiensis TaxID=1655491 RepID=A0A2G1VTQ9_9FLAO|nr:hypothetical protein [Leeuwenhoekiella nanhaiensis]PHQ30145.1 hypothetical protein CJ305_04050 [Leeuwenhoekiella nanhaiensis]
MKSIIFVLLVVISISSCKSEDDALIDNADLVGTWDWVQTSGGLIYFKETPETLGKSITLSFSNNYKFQISQDENEILSGNYTITYKKSIYTGEMARFIELSDATIYTGIVLRGIVNTYENTSLTINDNNHDGIGSVFIKAQ